MLRASVLLLGGRNAAPGFAPATVAPEAPATSAAAPETVGRAAAAAPLPAAPPRLEIVLGVV